jgi:xanthine dehydrogenase accessory factor
MGFDLDSLRQAVTQHGRVARVVIANIEGSSPREVGAAMLVWTDGQSGTIGGGALEYQAAQAARNASGDLLSRHALGPDLGQCCGGRITLLREIYDSTRLAHLEGQDVIARAIDGSEMPLSAKRILRNARAQGKIPEPQLIQGWFIEPLHRPRRSIWVWGAGHVGRAVVDVLAPIPDVTVSWVDTGPERFPSDIPQGVTTLPTVHPEKLAAHAPRNAQHLILTYSHALDLELCHQLLRHGFQRCGVIGSKTKWARFRSRLAALGHNPHSIARIECPIGDPTLGKHPQAIAIGVAGAILRPKKHKTSINRGKTG